MQQAVYGVLSTDTTLAVLGVTIYDHVHPRAEFPYIVIGQDFATPADTDDTLDADHFITIHTWDRIEANNSGHRGGYRIKQMQQACYAALHRQTLIVDGANFTDINGESAENFLDDDGLTRHGVQRFVILLDEVTP